MLRDYMIIDDLATFVREHETIVYACLYQDFMDTKMMNGFFKSREILNRISLARSTRTLDIGVVCFTYDIKTHTVGMETVFLRNCLNIQYSVVRMGAVFGYIKSPEVSEILRKRQLEIVRHYYRFTEEEELTNQDIEGMFLAIFNFLIEPRVSQDLIFEACNIMKEIEFYDKDWISFKYSKFYEYTSDYVRELYQNKFSGKAEKNKLCVGEVSKITIRLHPDLVDEAVDIFAKHKDFFESLCVIGCRKTLNSDISREFNSMLNNLVTLYSDISYVDNTLTLYVSPFATYLKSEKEIKEYFAENDYIYGAKVHNIIKGKVYMVESEALGFTKTIFVRTDTKEDPIVYLYTLVEDNIKKLFTKVMKTHGLTYKCPMDIVADKQHHTHMYVEKEIIKSSIRHSGISETVLKSEIFRHTPKDSVDAILLSNRMTVDFLNYDGKRQTTSQQIFDGIEVRVPVIKYDFTREELIKLIQKNKKEIDALVVEKIEERMKSHKSRLTMNYFQLDRMTLTATSELLYIFGLKKSLEHTEE